MKNLRFSTACLSFVLVFLLVSPPATVPQQEQVDLEMVAKIREEGLERSQVWKTFSQLVDVFGPRLTASPAFNAAARWARDELRGWGMDDAHLESFEFGRGWTLQGFTLEMLEPRYMPLMGYPKAWSPSTKGPIETSPLMLAGLTSNEIAAYQGQLSGPS